MKFCFREKFGRGRNVKFVITNRKIMKNSIRSIVALAIKGHFSPANINASAMEASVDVNTINTDNSIRDGHLRAEDYFDVLHYPLSP